MTNNSKERIKEQLARYHSDDPAVKSKALEEILDDYKKFITHIINKHFYSYKNQWYEDMFSVGVIGLIESLPKYDPDKSMPTTHFPGISSMRFTSSYPHSSIRPRPITPPS